MNKEEIARVLALMSTKGGKRLPPNANFKEGNRVDNDAYFTIFKGITTPLVKTFPFLEKATFIDPAVGKGDLLVDLKRKYPDASFEGTDIVDYKDRPSFIKFSKGDGRSLSKEESPYSTKVVVCNPPYTLKGLSWRDFVNNFLSVLKDTKNGYSMGCFLLNFNALGDMQRGLMVKTPPTFIIPLGRLDFTGQGNPSTSYAWVVWTRRLSGGIDTAMLNGYREKATWLEG